MPRSVRVARYSLDHYMPDHGRVLSPPTRDQNVACLTRFKGGIYLHISTSVRRIAARVHEYLDMPRARSLNVLLLLGWSMRQY